VYLITPELKKLADPAIDLLAECHLYIEQLAEEIAQKVFSRFPGVVNDIMEIVSNCLMEKKDKASKVVEAIIESEEGYLFTNDKEYMEKCTDIVPAEEGEDKEAARKTSRNQSYVNEIRKRLDMYFKIIVRGIRDSVPKAIGYFLVDGIQEHIQYELYAEINKNESMAETLGEPPEVTAERKTLNTSHETMKKSLKVLQRDPEITATLDYDDDLSRDIKESLKEAKKKQGRAKHNESMSSQHADPSRLNMSMMSGSGESSSRGSGRHRGDPHNMSGRSGNQSTLPKGAPLARKPAQGPV
jgi:hypothetical protein